MELEFRTDELTAYEYDLIWRVEREHNMAAQLDFIIRRSVVPPDPVRLWESPLALVNTLFQQAALAALSATRASNPPDLILRPEEDILGADHVGES